MRYRTVENNDKTYKVGADRIIVSPSEGFDYTIDRVKSKMGRLATVRGRIFTPVDSGGLPPKVQIENGWSAPAATYYGTAREMAKHGVAVATYDTYTPPLLDELRNPLNGAEKGGVAMMDMFEDIAGDGELALLGHSTGGLTALRIAAVDDRPDYWIGEAPVGLEHRNMHKAYASRLPGIFSEFYSYISKLPSNRDGLDVLRESTLLNATDPTRLVRQLYLLAQGPDLAPLLDYAKAKGMLNAVILFKDDQFLHYDKQNEVVERKKQLFDVICRVDDARHLHPNNHPYETALIRTRVLDTLRNLKLGRLACQNTI